MPKRTINTNDNLKKVLDILKDICSCIEDIIDESDNSQKSIRKICKDHDIDYLKLRRLFELKLIRNIYVTSHIEMEDIIIPKDPYDILYKDIFVINKEISIEYPIDFKESMDYVISNSLTQREQIVIKMRYGLNGYAESTYKEIGTILNNISGTRVSQLLNKALRKLHFHENAKILKIGLTQYNYERKQNEIKEQRLKDELNAMLEQQRNEAFTNYYSHMEEYEKELISISIDDLELSARSYNSIRRETAVKTLYDLALLSEDKLMKIRNLGKHSRDEIINKINQYLKKYNMDHKLFLTLYDKI